MDKATSTPAVVRCAVYTRKSTEEGLQQEFNSLMAQRESAEAYIASQREQGWIVIADRYDDGGFSGASMDRPALKRLLADVDAGRIDCLVVYKVDRLSRSLLDFARIMSTLDKRNVSFVSVTQQFNTSVPLGRLTLNILLSFAQFERELIGERTRDKMSAARRKGKWTGGIPVLGYDLDASGARLLVNEREAEQVRRIFGLFAENGALLPTLGDLDRLEWTLKSWDRRKGGRHIGKPFTRYTLERLLRNVTYLGLVNHKGDIRPGEHEPIVDAEVFEQVQQALQQNQVSSHGTKMQALLRGLLFCESCDAPMLPVGTNKRARTYPYYRCESAGKKGSSACPSQPLAAARIERSVVDHIAQLQPAAQVRALSSAAVAAELHRLVARVGYDGVTGRIWITLRQPVGDRG